MTTNALTKLLW